MTSYPSADFKPAELSFNNYKTNVRKVVAPEAEHIEGKPSNFEVFFMIPDLQLQDGKHDLLVMDPDVGKWKDKIKEYEGMGGGRMLFFFRKKRNELSVVLKDFSKIGFEEAKAAFKEIFGIEEVLKESEWKEALENIAEGSVAKDEKELLEYCENETARAYLKGIFNAKTPQEVAEAVFENFKKAGRSGTLKYKASSGAKGTQILSGATIGMCESYAQAFEEAIKLFNADIRFFHPVEALRKKPIALDIDRSLANLKFVTKSGLELMGGLKGNIHYEINADGKMITEDNIAKINQYLFWKHWTVVVAGNNYDMIFYTVNKDNLEYKLSDDRVSGNVKFVADADSKPGTGEFACNYIKLTDLKGLEENVDKIATFHKKNKAEIKRILDKKDKKADLVEACEKFLKDIEHKGFVFLLSCMKKTESGDWKKKASDTLDTYTEIKKVADLK